MAQVQYSGTGRRKNAVARVRLVPGTGKITVNKKDVEEYIPHADLREVINQPFGVTETKGAYDVIVNVNGGGYAGQSGAIRHGIARALLQVDPDFRSALKRAGLLTRDARMVERKNQVLKKPVKLHSSQNVNYLESLRTCSLTQTIWDEDFLGNRVPLNYHFERHFPNEETKIINRPFWTVFLN